LVQINSGSVKSEDEAKGLIESFKKEMKGYIKENFFGDERGNGKLGLALEERGKYLQGRNEAQKQTFEEIESTLAASLSDDDQIV
jgi:hypothetical protein